MVPEDRKAVNSLLLGGSRCRRSRSALGDLGMLADGLLRRRSRGLDGRCGGGRGDSVGTTNDCRGGSGGGNGGSSQDGGEQEGLVHIVLSVVFGSK